MSCISSGAINTGWTDILSSSPRVTLCDDSAGFQPLLELGWPGVLCCTGEQTPQAHSAASQIVSSWVARSTLAKFSHTFLAQHQEPSRAPRGIYP